MKEPWSSILPYQASYVRNLTLSHQATLDEPPSPALPPWLPISVYAWALQQLVYHAVGLLFEFFDRSGVIRQFKVRDTDRKSYTRMLPRVLANQCFILLPCMILSQILGFCFTEQPRHLSWSRFLISLPVMAVGHDIVQYLTHRYLLHQPVIPLMRALKHSIHHSTGATKAISACYMSAPDFFLEIVLPYLVPLALVGGGGSDILFHSLVAGLGAVGGLYEHSGYDFSVLVRQSKRSDLTMQGFVVSQFLDNLLDNRSHSEHHVKANVSFSDGFGSPGICDTLMGTRWDLFAKRRMDNAEREWQHQREHVRSVDELRKTQ